MALMLIVQNQCILQKSLKDPLYTFIRMYTFILFLKVIQHTCLFRLHVYSEGESTYTKFSWFEGLQLGNLLICSHLREQIMWKIEYKCVKLHAYVSLFSFHKNHTKLSMHISLTNILRNFSSKYYFTQYYCSL